MSALSQAEDHGPVVDGVIAARAALHAGDVLAAVEIISTLRDTYGGPVVEHVSLALASGPTGGPR